MRALFNQCPHCGSEHLPILSSDTIELNIKQDGPYVEEALDRLTDYLRKSLEVGVKAIVLIHGYGSSGEGGRIKWAIHDALENNRYSDRVDEYHFGEDVAKVAALARGRGALATVIVGSAAVAVAHAALSTCWPCAKPAPILIVSMRSLPAAPSPICHNRFTRLETGMRRSCRPNHG